MRGNIGIIDKIIRLLIAVAAFAAYFTGQVEGNVGYAVLAVGMILGLTALVSFCPLYNMLGMNSCSKCCPKGKDEDKK